MSIKYADSYYNYAEICKIKNVYYKFPQYITYSQNKNNLNKCMKYFIKKKN